MSKKPSSASKTRSFAARSPAKGNSSPDPQERKGPAKREGEAKQAVKPQERQASEEAVKWLETLERGETPKKREQFLAWLKASPLHVKEYLFARLLWEKSRYLIESDDAYIATTMIDCWECEKEIPVIALCAKEATIEGEKHKDKSEIIRMSEITAMDRYTAHLFAGAFPDFRPYLNEEGELVEYANHCPHCGLVYEDEVLHDNSEFLMLAQASPGSIAYVKIPGRIRLDGNEGFEAGDEDENLHALIDLYRISDKDRKRPKKKAKRTQAKKK